MFIHTCISSCIVDVCQLEQIASTIMIATKISATFQAIRQPFCLQALLSIVTPRPVLGCARTLTFHRRYASSLTKHYCCKKTPNCDIQPMFYLNLSCHFSTQETLCRWVRRHTSLNFQSEKVMKERAENMYFKDRRPNQDIKMYIRQCEFDVAVKLLNDSVKADGNTSVVGSTISDLLVQLAKYGKPIHYDLGVI